jgi:hypothetical protein
MSIINAKDEQIKVKIEYLQVNVKVLEWQIKLKVSKQSFKCKIQFIDRVYKERFTKYLYYCWITEHIVSQLAHCVNRVLEDLGFNVL